MAWLLGWLLAAAACSRPAGETPAPPSTAAKATPAEAAPPAEEATAEAVRRAEEAATALVTRLSGELQRALASGPPEAAIDVCASRAQAIAREIGAERDLTVGRTALRLRNPLNAPDDHDRAILERWLQAPSLPPFEAAESVGAEGRRELRFLRPIVLAPPCTACHGEAGEISPGVREALQRHYPEDQATGFHPGELRGAVTVRVALR